MKKSIILLLLAFCTLLISQPKANAFIITSNTEGVTSSQEQVNKAIAVHKPTIKERFSAFVIKKVLKLKMFSTPAPDGTKMNGMAVAGFITGVLGIFVLPTLLGALGIIFSAVGLVKVLKNPDIYKGKGLAIAGLICGIVALVIGVAALVAVA